MTTNGGVDQRSAMVDRPGAVLRFLYARFFRKIRFNPEEIERIRAAAARGPIVYVLGAVSYLDYLYFNYALKAHGLPLARFANGGVNTILLWPLRIAFMLGVAIWRLARGARLEAEDAAFARWVGQGEPTLLFLKPPQRYRLVGDKREAAKVRGRFAEELIALGRARPELAIQLVPMNIAWGRPAVRNTTSPTLDAFFGEREAPGRLRAFIGFLRHHRTTAVQVGEPIELQAFLEANAERGDDAAARSLRFELSGAIERERRATMGPPVKAVRRVRLEALRSRALIETIDSLVADGGDRGALEAQARKHLVEIAAKPKAWMFSAFKRALKFVFGRMYQGIDVDEKSMDQLREAARRGPLVLLPSHKSHIDYLVLSYVFYGHDLSPPHIAAGKNLSFFPIGFIFRRAGAFFIRRSFRGDALYTAVLNAYVRRILRDGFHLEFFIEGGRSRSGKLLSPRLGLLGMVVDAILEGAGESAQLVPMAINYEKVVEEGSYAAEAAGGAKKKEGLRSIVRARKVLRSRYGRIELVAGEPVPLKEALVGLGIDERSDAATRKAAVARLGHRVRYAIAQVTVVTPSALVAAACLATVTRELSRTELDRRVAWLAEVARSAGGRFAKALEADFAGSVDRAIALLQADDDVELAEEGAVIVVPEDRRPRLEYYRNGAIHVLGEAAIVAHALRVAGASSSASGVTPIAPVRDEALRLSRVLKHELIYRPGVTFDAVFAQTIDALAARGWLAREGDGGVRVVGEGATALAILGSQIESYLEGYALTARAAASSGLGGKELLARLTGDGEAALARGEITRREAISKPLFEGAVALLAEPDAPAIR